jgi:hypothetical protein
MLYICYSFIQLLVWWDAQAHGQDGTAVALMDGVLRDTFNAASPPDTAASLALIANIIHASCTTSYVVTDMLVCTYSNVMGQCSRKSIKCMQEPLSQAYAATTDSIPLRSYALDPITIAAVGRIHQAVTDVRLSVCFKLRASEPLSARVVEQILPFPLGAELWLKGDPRFWISRYATNQADLPAIRLIQAAIMVLPAVRNPVTCLDTLAQLCNGMIADAGELFSILKLVLTRTPPISSCWYMYCRGHRQIGCSQSRWQPTAGRRIEIEPGVIASIVHKASFNPNMSAAYVW